MDNLSRRLHDAKLGSSIDNASKALPPGYGIQIYIWDGEVTVVLSDPEGESTTDFQLDELSDEINEAVAYAINHNKDSVAGD